MQRPAAPRIARTHRQTWRLNTHRVRQVAVGWRKSVWVYVWIARNVRERRQLDRTLQKEVHVRDVVELAE